ncbi:MAG TPA: hypothetical protein VFE51_23875 [Verrucomicrobiae bacterium]|nr:hypothetical protein [Verrucomicrobiae bacterium]
MAKASVDFQNAWISREKSEAHARIEYKMPKIVYFKAVRRWH